MSPSAEGCRRRLPLLLLVRFRTQRNAIGNTDRTLRAVFKKSGVPQAHAHSFRHTHATELLGKGESFEDIADVLGNSRAVVRKHYAKWSPARLARIDELMGMVHDRAEYTEREVVN